MMSTENFRVHGHARVDMRFKTVPHARASVSMAPENQDLTEHQHDADVR